MLSLLFNSLHKGNTYTLWKLWNLEKVGIMTGFANWIDHFMFFLDKLHINGMSGHMVLFSMKDNGFSYDGRRSYTKCKLGSVITFIWKVCLQLPAFWEWNYIENILMYFSMEKCKPVMYLLIKGMILCEELYLNSWGKKEE